MGNKWEKVKLGDVAIFKNGKKIVEEKRSVHGKHNIYGSNGVIGKTDNILVENESIIIGRVGAYCGSIEFSIKSCWVTDNAISCMNKENSDIKFLYYILNRLPLREMAGGSAQPLINQSILSNIEISLPNLEEQVKISSILSSLDDKIQLNNEINKTLEDMAQAIFKAWFVDFEPFKDEEFEESELGMIPMGWKVKDLKGICQINMGQSPSSETYNDENKGLPFYQGIKDFTERFPLVTMYCSEPKKTAEKGDILLSVRAPVGSLNIAVESCCIGRGVASIKSGLYGNNFIYYLLKNIKWNRYESGTVFSSIKKSDIENYKVISPSIDAVNSFNNLIKTLDYKIYNNSMQNRELQEMRDTLLPKLISGEIKL